MLVLRWCVSRHFGVRRFRRSVRRSRVLTTRAGDATGNSDVTGSLWGVSVGTDVDDTAWSVCGEYSGVCYDVVSEVSVLLLVVCDVPCTVCVSELDVCVSVGVTVVVCGGNAAAPLCLAVYDWVLTCRVVVVVAGPAVAGVVSPGG